MTAERIARLFGVIVTAAILLLAGWLLLYADDDTAMYGCADGAMVFCDPAFTR